MTREIKFRVWDKKRKEWYGATDPASLTFKGFSLFGECMMSCFPSLNDLEYLETNQFTSLKDKNGNEIFEGDIVKFFDLNLKFSKATVYFENGCFYADDRSPVGNVSLGYLIKNNRGVEVIGNIYENPELLEAEND